MKKKNAMVISLLLLSTFLFGSMVFYLITNIKDESINSKAIKLLTVSIAGAAFILIDVFDSKLITKKGNMLMFRSVKHYLVDEKENTQDTVFIEDISKYIFERLQSKGSNYDVVFEAIEKYKKVDKEFDYIDFTELFIIDLASSKCPYSWYENAFIIPRLNGSALNSGPFDEKKVDMLYSQELLKRVPTNKLLQSYVFYMNQIMEKNKVSNFDPHYFPKKNQNKF